MVRRRAEHQARQVLRRLPRDRLQPQDPVRRGAVGTGAGAVGSRTQLSCRGYSDSLLQVHTYGERLVDTPKSSF